MIFPRQPQWAAAMEARILKEMERIMSEDAAVEQDVAAINADVTALSTLIESLKNVNVGDTITAQTKADLDAAVAALGNVVSSNQPPAPPAPAPAT